MRKLSLAVLLSTGIVGTSFAVPLVDLKAGVGYISLSPSGYVSYDGSDIDVEKDLNWGNSKNVYGFVEMGFNLLPLPSVKLEYLKTKFEGTGNVSKNINFGLVSFNVRDRVYSKFDVNQYDISLFYNLPIPIITPRAGLALKYLDGNVYVKSLSTQREENVDLTLPIPLLYVGLTLDVPAIPIEVDAEGKGIAINGHMLLDTKLTAKLTLIGLPLIGKAYIGGGYRYQRFKLKDVDIDGKKLNTDIKFKGPFAEIGIEF